MNKLIFLITALLSIATPSYIYAWSGYDVENNTEIEIERGNLVRSGREIEIFDYSDGSYKDVGVESIQRLDNAVEIEVYDYQGNEYRTFEMDR